MHLTRDGELLLGHAHDVLQTIEAAKSDVRRLGAARRGEVTLGVFADVPRRLVARAVTVFAERRPDVRVAVVEATTDAPLFTQLRQGRIDVAFAYLPPEEGPFAVCELLKVPCALVVPAGGALSRQRDLARLPMIGAKTARYGAPLEAHLRSRLGNLQIVFRCDVADTAQALVAAGVGAAIVPRLAVTADDERVDIVSLGDLVPDLTLGLVWHQARRLPGAVQDLRDAVRQSMSGDE